LKSRLHYAISARWLAARRILSDIDDIPSQSSSSIPALQAGPHGNAAEVGVIKDLVFLTARPQLIEAFTHATLTSTGVMTNVRCHDLPQRRHGEYKARELCAPQELVPRVPLRLLRRQRPWRHQAGRGAAAARARVSSSSNRSSRVRQIAKSQGMAAAQLLSPSSRLFASTTCGRGVMTNPNRRRPNGMIMQSKVCSSRQLSSSTNKH